MDPSEAMSPFFRLMSELQSNSGRKLSPDTHVDRTVGVSLIGGGRFPPYDHKKETVKPMDEKIEGPLADTVDELNSSDEREIHDADTVTSPAEPLKLAADQKSNVPLEIQDKRDASNRTPSNYKSLSRQLTLNATVRNVKEWSIYQGPYLSLLFDVYSVLDSDITYNRFGGSQFTLRDQTGCLVATYYAIDEEIIPAKVGDWLRVEGVVRSWGFQATAVKYAEANFLKGLREKIIASKIALESRLQLLCS